MFPSYRKKKYTERSSDLLYMSKKWPLPDLGPKTAPHSVSILAPRMSRHLTPNKHHPSRSGANLDTVRRNDTPATAAGTGPMLAAPCTHRAAKPIALAPSPPGQSLVPKDQCVPNH